MSTKCKQFFFLRRYSACVGVFYPKGVPFPDDRNTICVSRGEYLPVTCLMSTANAIALASRLRASRSDLSVIVLHY